MFSQQSSLRGMRTTLVCQAEIAAPEAASLGPPKMPQPWMQAYSVPAKFTPRRTTLWPLPSTSRLPDTASDRPAGAPTVVIPEPNGQATSTSAKARNPFRNLRRRGCACSMARASILGASRRAANRPFPPGRGTDRSGIDEEEMGLEADPQVVRRPAVVVDQAADGDAATAAAELVPGPGGVGDAGRVRPGHEDVDEGVAAVVLAHLAGDDRDATGHRRDDVGPAAEVDAGVEVVHVERGGQG